MLPADERLRAVQMVAVGEVRREMEARRVQRGYLQPEHLALGLLSDAGIAKVFNTHGATAEVQRVIEVGLKGEWRDPPGEEATEWEVHHSLRATVLESIAQAEAKRLGHASVTPSHLALAFVLDESTLVSQALMSLGVDQAIREQLLVELDGRPVGFSGMSSAERLGQVQTAVLLANYGSDGTERGGA